MKSKDHMKALGVALWLLTGAAAIPACADKKESATSPCPCAAGNFCCSSGVCAKDEASCGQATLALAQEAAGTWTGYFENFSLDSGSDALKISLAVSGQTTSGQVVVGERDAPPPPTDRNVFWPPGSSDGGLGKTSDLIEGFVYQAQDVRWESRRLKFKVPLAPAWQPLCDLVAATPITADGQTFICPADGWSWTPSGCRLNSGTELSEADCATLMGACTAGGRCQCGQTSCTANAGELSIDVALRGNEGDGSASGTVNANIRLIRSSH